MPVEFSIEADGTMTAAGAVYGANGSSIPLAFVSVSLTAASSRELRTYAQPTTEPPGPTKSLSTVYISTARSTRPSPRCPAGMEDRCSSTPMTLPTASCWWICATSTDHLARQTSRWWSSKHTETVCFPGVARWQGLAGIVQENVVIEQGMSGSAALESGRADAVP